MFAQGHGMWAKGCELHSTSLSPHSISLGEHPRHPTAEGFLGSRSCIGPAWEFTGAARAIHPPAIPFPSPDDQPALEVKYHVNSTHVRAELGVLFGLLRLFFIRARCLQSQTRCYTRAVSAVSGTCVSSIGRAPFDFGRAFGFDLAFASPDFRLLELLLLDCRP